MFLLSLFIDYADFRADITTLLSGCHYLFTATPADVFAAL